MENGNEAVAPALIVRSVQRCMPDILRNGGRRYEAARVEFIDEPVSFAQAEAHLLLTDGWIVSMHKRRGIRGGFCDMLAHKAGDTMQFSKSREYHIVTRYLGKHRSVGEDT